MGSAEQLKLKELSLKTVMLVVLLSGQRCQTIHALKLSGMTQQEDQISFKIDTLLKTSKPGKHIKPLVLKAWTEDRRLCVVTCLKQYLLQTASVRNGKDELWLSFNKPHKPVSKDTIARWIKTVLGEAGIDPSYGAHSTRSAATSAASSTNLPIDIIMNAAGWSKESTFQKFYNKPIEQTSNFGEHLLLSHTVANK